MRTWILVSTYTIPFQIFYTVHSKKYFLIIFTYKENELAYVHTVITIFIFD